VTGWPCTSPVNPCLDASISGRSLSD